MYLYINVMCNNCTYLATHIFLGKLLAIYGMGNDDLAIFVGPTKNYKTVMAVHMPIYFIHLS